MGRGAGVGLLENQQSKDTESEGHTTPAAVTHRAQFAVVNVVPERLPPWMNCLLILG